MDIMGLLRAAFDGLAPLISAGLTLIVMWRFLDQKAAVQLSSREAKIREFLSQELNEVKKELRICEEGRDKDRSRIRELEEKVRELEWQRDHQNREP